MRIHLMLERHFMSRTHLAVREHSEEQKCPETKAPEGYHACDYKVLGSRGETPSNAVNLRAVQRVSCAHNVGNLEKCWGRMVRIESESKE